MKLAGSLLLVAGWLITLSAVALIGAAMARTVFVLSGVGVELLGLALVSRAHMISRGEA